MCGRYFIDEESEGFLKLRAHIADIQPSFDFSAIAKQEVFPSQSCLVLQAKNGILQAQIMQWGLPKWNHKGIIVNARQEGIGEKPFFQDAVKSQRCVIIASGYYEWDAFKQKHYFHHDSPLLYMAGIYKHTQGMDCFAVLTTQVDAIVSPHHHRMPLLLSKESIRHWAGDTYASILS